MPDNPRAIIADDEEEVRIYLKSSLLKVWPELDICAEAKNGLEALMFIENEKPDIAFLDIRMPGLSGMEVARKVAGSCWIVFITAYDQYAVEAFENEAIDYLLKQVTIQRLEKTVSRLKNKINSETLPPKNLSQVIGRLLGDINEKTNHLKWIRAQHGETIRLTPVDDVIYFKASDRYTMVITKKQELLISKSIKQLANELNPEYFWQIHRGTIVNVAYIEKVSRSMTGRFVIKLKDTKDMLTVSRSYTHLFKQM